MRKRIKIRKTDSLRAMLTETLPYEVPLLFSNEGFYSFLKSSTGNRLKEEFQLEIFKASKPWSVPYTYKIRKNSSEFRSLSVMHPVAQKRVAEFYSKYDSIILALCQRSDWSLRAPVAVASYYVEKFRAENAQSTKTEHVEEHRTGFESVPRTASSYFVYGSCNFLHKFFESSDFHSLEKQFHLLRKLDISQCFPRIYTHTISWAIKSKKFAKNNLSPKVKRFEDEFDSIMQSCNYNETAGIIVGPEISRIFAEIILQRIDLDIEEALKNRKLSSGGHYVIRRYVDDYFVFANDDATLQTIQEAISVCLLEYKLGLNLAKSQTLARPFSTAETSARIEVAKVITEHFQRYVSSEIQDGAIVSATQGEEKSSKVVQIKLYKPKYIGKPSTISNVLIRDIKRSLKSSGADFDSTSNYFFHVAKRQLLNYSRILPFSKLDAVLATRISDFLYIFLEIIFFYYAMTPRVRPTYIVSEIIILLTRYLKDAPTEVAERITTKIIEESTMIMRNSAHDAHDNIEILNLLIALRSLGRTYKIDQSLILKFLQLRLIDSKIEFRNTDFGYFQIVSCLYYIGNLPDYAALRIGVCNEVCRRFEIEDDWETKAEMVFLFLDFIRCPYVESQYKIDLVKSCLRRKSKNDLNKRAKSLIAYLETQDWFFFWDKEVSLADALERKNLRTPY
jgi:hypothetical protein